MKTVQMTLDEELIKAVDHMVKKLKTNRSAFTRQALHEALERLRIRELEEQHRLGYEKFPKTESEFGNWESERIWGDE
ncbi:CopG family transcriptional regulator [bacterium]|jgi:metal-responsive CopG/Arc/MetJ family transcriptional regulator|nr:CopG family transcriptional regulator [bacterium]